MSVQHCYCKSIFFTLFVLYLSCKNADNCVFSTQWGQNSYYNFWLMNITYDFK